MTRVALMGFGSAAQTLHGPLLTQAGMSVVAISTRDPDRRRQAGEMFPDAHIVDGPAALLVQRPELVVVASPSHHHLDNALACIEAGIAVVVDKPLGVDATQAMGLVDAARRAKVPLTVFQNRRFDPEHATLAEVVRRQLVGESRLLELRWDRWRPVPKDRWRERNDTHEGGGILLDLHTHLIDQAVQLFGPVESVYAELASYTTTAEDDAFLALRHVDAMVSHVSSCAVEGAPGPRVRLRGSTGSYLLAAAGTEPTAFTEFDTRRSGGGGVIVTGEERTAVDLVTGPAADPVQFYRRVDEALHCADPQAAMPVDPADAVHVLAVIDAARVSARARRVVEVVTPGGCG